MSRRLYRGFKSFDEARNLMKTDPGDNCRLIDRRSGERIAAQRLSGKRVWP